MAQPCGWVNQSNTVAIDTLEELVVSDKNNSLIWLRLFPFSLQLNDWVVCKLFYKERVVKKGENAAAAAAENDPSSEAGENDFWPEGDEGAWMESAAQTLGNCERDLCAEFYQIGTSDADNFSPWM
jgi:hypothetical protein